MDGTFDIGSLSPEEAARGDIPPQFVTTLGTEVRGDSATVWLLTNDAAYFEPITVFCELKDGRWHDDGHSGGLVTGTPPEIKERARAGLFRSS
jgi:hypothetical protein